MGRAPCCDKANVKKGPWSPEEDAKLKSYIEQHGTGGNWIALPQKIGLKRCGKSCRLRWLNYLRPNIKHGGFSEEEDNIICSLYSSIGSRWSVIAGQLPGRTDNDIKNYWNTRLKKKLIGKHRKEQQARVNSSKQVVKQPRIHRGSLINSAVPGETTGEQPYYLPKLPVLAPVAYMTQEPSFSDHDSIRKLLIKLGGRFSEDDKEYALDDKRLQFATGHYSPAPAQSYEQQVNALASSACMNALNNDAVQVTRTQYYVDEAALTMVEGENALSAGLIEDMAVSANLERLDRFEFLCGEDIVNYKMGSYGGMGSSWGETGSQSQVYPSIVASSYEDMRHERPYECAFEEFKCQEAQFQTVHL